MAIRLSNRDLTRYEREVARFHRRVSTKPDGVGPAFLKAITNLVPGELATVLLGPTLGDLFFAPAETVDATSGIRQEDIDSHPCMSRRTRGAMCVSDHVNRRQWDRTAIYQHYFRPFGVEDDLGIDVDLGAGFLAKACVMRSWRRFTQTDHALLTLLGPHLASAVRQANLTQRTRGLLRAGIEEGMGGGVIFLDARHRVIEWSPQTRAALARAFGLSTQAMRRLPPELAEWVERQQRGVVPVFVRTGGGLRVEFHFVPDAGNGGGMLVMRGLDLRAHTPGVELSERERQVLTCAAEGLRNAEIAARLGVAPGTVKRHLENAYAKLDASNRQAAIARMHRE